jgi:hypothetical protein
MATFPYLTVEEFTIRATIPRSFVDDLERQEPGWVAMQLKQESGWINARLLKRYAVPFASPYPDTACYWLTLLVQAACLRRRGVNALDSGAIQWFEDEKAARLEVEKAANPENGTYELPLRDDTTAEGVTRKGPSGYAEHSPYAWTDQQRAKGREEDNGIL